MLSRPRERIASRSSIERRKAASSNVLVYWAPRPRVKDRKHLQRIRIAHMSETTEIPHSFEAALSELEDLVGRMESGDLPLQESLAVYKRGAELLAYCQNALKDAELQVQVLEKGLLQPFQPDDANNG